MPNLVGTDPRPARALCISGLAVEAKIARAAGLSVVVGAGNRERTEALIEAAATGMDCLVSFGIAGGLAPRLPSGTVIVSGNVVSERQRWTVDDKYHTRLNEFASGIGAVEGPVFAASAVLATRSEKQRAWAATGALAVDLESEIVARVAAALGIPFLVLRTVADTARRDLPPASLIPLAADGTLNHSRIFAAVLRRPFQLAGLIGLAHETRRALSALVGPARALSVFVGAA